MMSKHVLLLGLLVMINSTSSLGASLNEFVQSAIDNNYSLQNSKQALVSQDFQVMSSVGAMLPSLSMSANTTLNESTSFASTGADTESKYNENGYSLSISQSIFDPKAYLGYKGAKIDLDIKQIRYHQTYNRTINQVVSSYFSYLKTLAQIRTTRLEIEASETRLKQIKRSFELGNVAKTDVYETQADLEGALASMIGLEKELNIAQRQLKEITLLDDTPSYDIKLATPIVNIEDSDKASWRDYNLENNYDIILARKDLKKSKNTLQEKMAKFAPTISFSGSYSFTNSNNPSSNVAPLNGDSDNQTYSLNFNLPLLSGGSNYYGLRKAKQDLKIAQTDFEDTVNSAEADLDEAIFKINANVLSMKTLEKTIESNQYSYESLKKAYQFGTRSLSDLLSAERQLYNTIRDYYSARYDHFIDLTNFHNINGGLNISMIDEMANSMQSFDPNSPLAIPFTHKKERDTR